jgi:hypothetical protein
VRCTRRRITETPGLAAGQRSRRRQRSARYRIDERPGRLRDSPLRTDAGTGSSRPVAEFTLPPQVFGTDLHRARYIRRPCKNTGPHVERLQ